MVGKEDFFSLCVILNILIISDKIEILCIAKLLIKKIQNKYLLMFKLILKALTSIQLGLYIYLKYHFL